VLEAKGWHINSHHGTVFGSDGGVMPPLLIGAALHSARREGLLPGPSEQGDGTVAKSVSGVGESMPSVEHLDLRQQP
jgi:hypothetical protein